MHVAVFSYQGTSFFAKDGIIYDSFVNTTDIGSSDADSSMRLGANYNGTDLFKGEMDELRLTKGISRYTPDGASQSGIVPSTATGAGSTGSSIPTMPYLRPTPYVATDGNRGYFGQGNVKLLVKSDTFPGDTNFYDSSATFNQNEVDGDFTKSIISKFGAQIATIDRWQSNGIPTLVEETTNQFTVTLPSLNSTQALGIIILD